MTEHGPHPCGSALLPPLEAAPGVPGEGLRLSESITAHPRRVNPQNQRTREAPGAFLHAGHAQASQPGTSRNSPGWQRGRPGHGSAAVPVTSEAAGATQERRWLSQLPVTAGERGWQRSAAVSPVRDTPEVAVTLRPAGFPFPGSPPGSADPIKRGC